MAFNWYKDGTRVLPTPRVQIRGAVIEIADVTYEDSGLYVCVLRGHKEPTRNFTITVAGKGTHTSVCYYLLITAFPANGCSAVIGLMMGICPHFCRFVGVGGRR